MKNTTLTIAILMSIAGTFCTPAFGMEQMETELLKRPTTTTGLSSARPAPTCLEKTTKKVTKSCNTAGAVCVGITEYGVTAASCGVCLSLGCGCDPATAIIGAMFCGMGTLCCHVLHATNSNNQQ